MFPHNYTFNPGMVLDPVTMTPMLAGSGNITVNPLGVPMRPENKVWQKMFINDIPQECTNQLILKLLNEFGLIKNFKRAVDNRARLMPFCHFQLQTGEQILRIKRLFSNVNILDKSLQLKISSQTEDFVKQWISIQKDEWRKKLNAPGMNQAKQYSTIQVFFERQDKQYKQKIQQTLRIVNNQVKVIARQRMRDEQRKQHPRQKQRTRKKQRLMQDSQRSFNQKQQYWLKRERQREKQYKRQKERQRQKQKAKNKRLEKQLNQDTEQEERRSQKYLTPQRRKLVQKEQLDDIQIILQENPPLPEEMPQQKKRIAFSTEQIKLTGQNKIEGDVLVQLPQRQVNHQVKDKQFKKNELFNDWQKHQVQQQQKPIVELHLPQVMCEQQANLQQQTIKVKLSQLQKKVPQSKQDLWLYQINWDKLSKSVVLQKYIRPWLQKQSDLYIGGVEEKFIALVEKRLLSRSHPDKVIKVLKHLLDDDSEEFVIKLWKKLIFQYLKLQAGLL